MCTTCGGKGIVRLNWSDAPDNFGLCLCEAGMDMRCTTNAGKDTGYALWQVWCAQNQIAPSRVFLLEEALTPDELTEAGFRYPAGPVLVAQSREAILLGLDKTKRGKL